MKNVYIVRHAKSAWGSFDVADHDRELLPIGIEKTKRVIVYFNSVGVKPDLIICSTANRAIETAKLIAAGIGYDVNKIVKNKLLYHAYGDDIYNELHILNDDIETVMIIAHNPTLTDFVNDFITPQIDNLPTSGAVLINFKTKKWNKISTSKFNIGFSIFPKMLK